MSRPTSSRTPREGVGWDLARRPAGGDRTASSASSASCGSSPDVDAGTDIARLGIHSATQIATMGQQQFFTQRRCRRPDEGRGEPRLPHRGAALRQRRLDLSSSSTATASASGRSAIGSIADLDDPTQQAIARDESLATLFGSQDYCATDECTSVLSPAAYLCDLLLWLRGHSLTGAFATALDALVARRPDIRHLLLNCPNTETRASVHRPGQRTARGRGGTARRAVVEADDADVRRAPRRARVREHRRLRRTQDRELPALAAVRQAARRAAHVPRAVRDIACGSSARRCCRCTA